MKPILFILIMIMTALLSASCGASYRGSVVPIAPDNPYNDTLTIIWNGISEAYMWDGTNYNRFPTLDYRFSVINNRYDKVWKSVKALHRLHPDYNGMAGDRDQFMYFQIEPEKAGTNVNVLIHSSLGEGEGKSDLQFRNMSFTIRVKGATDFWPYNRIRLVQHYGYEEGLLTETLYLYKEKDGVETPFMKNEEKAQIYLKGSLPKAPTDWN